MFDGSWNGVTPEGYSAFKPLVQTLVEESSAFDGEVYLFDGDSHIFVTDSPLAAGSRWLDFYGVQGSADNLTRVTVDGSAQNTNYLKVWVNKGRTGVLSWKQIPYSTQP